MQQRFLFTLLLKRQCYTMLKLLTFISKEHHSKIKIEIILLLNLYISSLITYFELKVKEYYLIE